MNAIVFSFVAFLSTVAGGFFAIRYREHLHTIISFSVGVLLGVTFFDIIPEIFAAAQENNLSVTPALVAVVCGFLFIHILEKLAVIHNAHEDEYADHRHPLVGTIGASGLVFHSLLDGIGIGLGFHVSTHVGLVVAIAVIAHDFCDGLNMVTLMLVNKNTRAKAIKLLVFGAIAPVLGALSTYLFVLPASLLLLYLGFFAGFLLYISASDLLPEAHSKHSSVLMLVLTVLGAAFIFFITRLV
jgi:ZIP family zinc transporter